MVEGINIPRAEPAFWVYKEVGGTEDLGERLVEVAPDITRHERRDPTACSTRPMRRRVRWRAASGSPPPAMDKGKTQICATCHLANLEGTDKIPPIAGRSPTYLLRQLIAFKNGTRSGEAANRWMPVIEKLELEDMVALAAYVGSLYP